VYVGRVGCFGSIGRVGIIARIPGMIAPSGDGFVRLPKRGRGLAFNGFTSCSDEKAGWSTRSAVHRIYREEGLTVRLRRRQKRASHLRMIPPQASQVNERWSMDFVADTLVKARNRRPLSKIDNLSRHSPLIEPDFTLTGTKVVAVLERIAKRSGYPKMIRMKSSFTPGPENPWTTR